MIDRQAILTVLETVQDPVHNASVVAANMVSGLVIKEDAIGFALEVDPKRGQEAEPLRKETEDALKTAFPQHKITVVLTAHNQTPKMSTERKQLAQPEQNGLVDVQHVIAVASGKGGVGKSTVAVNLAAALAAQGLNVGLLDADIYGPSVPKMVGKHQRAELTDDKLIQPHTAQGMAVMSMGFMVDEDAPLVWRGPMVISAIRQMLYQVKWGALDVLVVDMPPGTGDAQLTLSQRAPLDGVVIVTTPQDIALIDARKGIEMFKKMDVSILGLVENMSVFTCPSCGHEEHLFGCDGGKSMADQLGIPLLGQIPLNLDIRTLSDDGKPMIQHAKDHAASSLFAGMAQTIWDGVKKKDT